VIKLTQLGQLKEFLIKAKINPKLDLLVAVQTPMYDAYGLLKGFDETKMKTQVNACESVQNSLF